MNFDTLAQKSIAGLELDREECRSVLESCDAELMDLLAAAFRVRQLFCGMKVHIHVLSNARSGLCPEDCNYCSQSALSNADYDKYPLINREALVAEAQRAKEAKARRFCIVTMRSVTDPRDVHHVVTDEHHRSMLEYFPDALVTLGAKADISNCEHLIQQQNIWF